MMKMIKKTTLLILLCLAAAMQAQGAVDAAKTLDAVATKVRTSKSISATYSLTGTNQISGSGTITLAGERFAMTSPKMSVWYDGTTQWTYSAADNEVNVSEPTAAELQQINPFAIINSFRQTYSAKTLSSTKTSAKIQLTAKSTKADIRIATVTVNLSTMLPTQVQLKLASGQTVTLTISNAKIGNALAIDTFRFPKAKYPRAEVIDLR